MLYCYRRLRRQKAWSRCSLLRREEGIEEEERGWREAPGLAKPPLHCPTALHAGLAGMVGPQPAMVLERVLGLRLWLAGLRRASATGGHCLSHAGLLDQPAAPCPCLVPPPHVMLARAAPEPRAV